MGRCERWSRAPTVGARLWLWVGSLIALLAAMNVINNRVVGSGSTAVRSFEVIVLFAFAFASRRTATDLGLDREGWGRGLRWAGAMAGLVAAAYVLVLAIPVTRPLLLDRRADFSVAVALAQAMGPVLAGTVLLEEFAFRGLLWGLLWRLRGPTVATWASSALFGLWHVLPAWNLPAQNQVASDLLGTDTPARLAAVALGVVFTTVAGVVFSELRRRSGSLLAPIGLHWATNGLGYVVAALAWRL